MNRRIMQALITTALFSALALAAADDAKRIMAKSQEAMKMDGSESIATLSISDQRGNTRIRKFSSASRKYPDGTTKMVMRFLEPADVSGTGILTIDNVNGDDDMWIYMPALRKSRPIVSTEKTKSFMGSEFSNADITTPNIDDYVYTLAGKEKIGDLDCWKIEAIPANDVVIAETGYSKKIVWVAEKDYMARKTDFYDRSGALLKTLAVHEVKLLDEKNKKYQATDITMTNVRNNRTSRFKIGKIIFNPDVSDDYFTIRYLEK